MATRPSPSPSWSLKRAVKWDRLYGCVGGAFAFAFLVIQCKKNENNIKTRVVFSAMGNVSLIQFMQGSVRSSRRWLPGSSCFLRKSSSVSQLQRLSDPVRASRRGRWHGGRSTGVHRSTAWHRFSSLRSWFLSKVVKFCPLCNDRESPVGVKHEAQLWQHRPSELMSQARDV